MFWIGVMSLAIGMIFVYKTGWIISVIPYKVTDNLIKLIGLIIAVLGVIIVIYSEFPPMLESIRIFK